MGISLTPAAVGAVRAALSLRGHGMGVRLCVSMTGCSGMSYWLEFVDELRENETTIEQDGVRIVFETRHLVYFNGIGIDYVRQENAEGFVISSPNLCQDDCTCPDGSETC
ncbi:MAG: iron-sulfur cluster assembly accessory protein [Formivibrio sp.]|nr:iron-sulfur cluster assembly accessory protein [Formivibrio sp.]